MIWKKVRAHKRIPFRKIPSYLTHKCTFEGVVCPRTRTRLGVQVCVSALSKPTSSILSSAPPPPQLQDMIRGGHWPMGWLLFPNSLGGESSYSLEDKNISLYLLTVTALQMILIYRKENDRRMFLLTRGTISIKGTKEKVFQLALNWLPRDGKKSLSLFHTMEMEMRELASLHVPQ